MFMDLRMLQQHRINKIPHYVNNSFEYLIKQVNTLILLL